jgi:putative ABC transport system permease protein
MLPSWQLALNTLVGKPGRTTLMIGAIALASSLVVAISCAIASMQASMEAGIIKFLGSADARIIHPANSRFDDVLLELVRAWPEVEAASPRLGGSTVLIRADQKRHAETGQLLRSTPQAYGVDFEVDHRFRTLDLVDGRSPQSAGEILIDEVTAKELHAAVGDMLEIQRFGDPIRLIVAGIYRREFLAAVQRPLVELDRRVLAEASDRPGQITSIWLIVKPGIDVRSFCAKRQSQIPAQLVLEPAEMVRSGYDRQIVANRLGLTAGSMLTFISASFIIVTALTTSVTERQREMAVTRCIGASRRQLFVSQLLAGLVLAGAGAVLGLPSGLGLALLLVWYFGELMTAGLHVHEVGLGLAMAGSIASGVLGALYPAWMASRVSPLEAMTVRARPPRPAAIATCAGLAATLISVQAALMLIPDTTTRFYVYVYGGLPAVHIGYFLLAVPLLVGLAVVLSYPLGIVLGLPRDMLARSLRAFWERSIQRGWPGG